jgi:hypothetical protein
MIKISELEEIGSGPLLANTTAIIPISTGNVSLDTFKTTLSTVGEYILSNLTTVSTTNLTVISTITVDDITANTVGVTEDLTANNLIALSNVTAVNALVSGNISTNYIIGNFAVISSNVTAANINSVRCTASNIDVSSNLNVGNVISVSDIVVGNALKTNKILLGNSDFDTLNSSSTSIDPTKGLAVIDTTGGALAGTLSSAVTTGSIKVFAMTVNGGNFTLTVTNAGWNGGASGTIVFNTEGDGCTLIFISNRWFVMSNNGVSVS